ncbi:HlyD family secretion protein [Alsobacter sp. SYSU M60028]|uniref:HlyD family secretion protein n=1 Tax=Alsobacter ponti TaxID=2962936 RepID=A0ABT1LIS2_9HYPH|nr:HlyD family secretion protein [Alsobacter ponti]MCP8940793.1 HlyD family secretion protein [Alsobacter ponti]
MSDAKSPEAAAQAATPPASPSQEVAMPARAGHPAGLEGEVLRPRRSRKRLILPLVALAALGAGGYYGYGYYTTGRFIVSTDDAYVKADVTTLAAKVPGYIAEVAEPNSHVRAGDVVARIDDGDYRLAVEAARGKLATQQATVERYSRQIEAQQATLAQARAQLTAAEADAARAEADFQRATQLAAAEYGSKQRLDAARAERDRLQAGVEAARAAIATAQANIEVTRAQQEEARGALAELRTALARAERDLSFTVVTAPVDGVIGNRAAERGNYAQAGARLAALVPLHAVYVEANFKETQLARLKPGQAVDIDVDALPGHTIHGRVESFAPGSGSVFSLLPPENATGNFTKIVQRVPVRISIQSPVDEGALRPGLSVVAQVRTADPVSASKELAAR